MESVLDEWWGHAKTELLSKLRDSTDFKTLSEPSRHSIDYHGDLVGYYSMIVEGEQQNVSLEPTGEIDDETLEPLYDVIIENGYTYKTTPNGLTVYMDKGDRWGSILKTAAWTFSRLGDE